MSWCVIGVGVGWSLQPYEVKVTALFRRFISIHDLYLLPDFSFHQFVVELYQIAAHFTTSCLKVTQHASSHHDPNSFRHPHLLPHSTVSLQPALDSVCVLDRWQRNLRCGFCWAKRDMCSATMSSARPSLPLTPLSSEVSVSFNFEDTMTQQHSVSAPITRKVGPQGSSTSVQISGYAASDRNRQKPTTITMVFQGSLHGLRPQS
jgi:hypothetical protein